MNLKQRLEEDMKAALRAREEGKERLSVIRMVRAAVRNTEIERRHELSDDEVIEVLSRELKQRRDAIAEFGAAAGPEYVGKLEGEIAILMVYLPSQLSPDELREVSREVIQEVGATGPQDLGKVMSALMPRVRGRVDGKLVNQTVRELLG